MASTPSWRSKQRLAEVSAEFLGTGLFLFVTVSSVVNWGGPILEPIGIAVAFGGSITVLAAAFGDISGGHFNCAVTLGLMANRSIDPVKAVQYIWAQVTGAIVGASLARACARDYASSLQAVNLVSHGYSDGQVFGAEYIATALLVVTVILTTNAQRTVASKALAPIAIGGAVFLSHLVLVPADGCSINPARSLGAAIAAGGGAPPGTWRKMWIFCISPALAGLTVGLAEFTWRKTFAGLDIPEMLSINDVLPR
jgi:MIP family channel proteins